MIIKNIKPLFKRGSILDKEILEYLRDDAKEYFEMNYRTHSNGVIKGLEIRVCNNKLMVGPGIFKWYENIYKLKESIGMEVSEKDGDYILKLEILPNKENGKNKISFYQILLDEELPKEETMEICRIKRREGANVRNYNKFIGHVKEYNQVNLVNQINSTATGERISIELLRLFAEEILEKKEIDGVDQIICFKILEGTLERKSLDAYIKIKLGVESNKYKNIDVYYALEEILKKAKNKFMNKISRDNNIKKMILE
ncbi:MAG: hypothetical protein ACRC0S_06575 [Fusobacteriaceae bacterium]